MTKQPTRPVQQSQGKSSPRGVRDPLSRRFSPYLSSPASNNDTASLRDSIGRSTWTATRASALFAPVKTRAGVLQILDEVLELVVPLPQAPSSSSNDEKEQNKDAVNNGQNFSRQ